MTNSRRVADVVLKYSVDQGSASAAQQANKRLKTEMQFLAAQQADVNREFRTAGTEAQAYNRNLQSLEANALQTARALDDLARPRDIDVRTQRFDEVSRDVGLAGDVQSNLGAIGGLAGAAGLGGAGQGIAVGGELVALIEELPRLKTAVQGLPSTVNAAGAALGGTGAGLIGALGIAAVAIGAVAIAAQRAAKQIQAAAEDFNQVIDARVETEKLIALGETTTKQAQELARARQAEADAVRKVQAELVAAQQGLSGFQRLLSRIADILPGVTGLGDQIKELDSEADGLEAEAGQLTQAIEAGRFAAADRAAAEQKAAGIAQQTANQRVSSETKLSGAMQETVASAQKATGAISELSGAAKQFDRERSGQANAGRGVFNVNRARKKAAEAERKEATSGSRSGGPSIGQQIADEEAKAAQQRFEQGRQFNRDIQRIERETQRRLTDIREQAAFEGRKAARGRDFAGLFDLQEQTALQERQANTAAQRQAEDRRIALDQQLADLNRANNQQLAALRAKQQAESQILQQGYNNALGAARVFVRDLRNEFMQGQRDGVQAAVRREMAAITGAS